MDSPFPLDAPWDDMPDVVQRRMNYGTIVADPPWHYPSFKGRPMPYRTMTVSELRELPVGHFAAADCRLFLWATSRHLRQAFDVLKAWEFSYSLTLVWHKTGDPMQFTKSIAPIHSEFVLVGRRGKPKILKALPSSVFSLPTNNHNPHSKKPEAFLDIVESASPGPYLELFARRQRLGWDTWGDESLQHVDLNETASLAPHSPYATGGNVSNQDRSSDEA